MFDDWEFDENDDDENMIPLRYKMMITTIINPINTTRIGIIISTMRSIIEWVWVLLEDDDGISDDEEWVVDVDEIGTE